MATAMDFLGPFPLVLRVIEGALSGYPLVGWPVQALSLRCWVDGVVGATALCTLNRLGREGKVDQYCSRETISLKQL